MKKALIQQFEQSQLEKLKSEKKDIPKFNVGDTVSVKYKITEGTTTRLQAFQGVVIAKTKDDSNFNATFTVRKISSGIGVERKFVLYSPLVESIEVLKNGVVRRAKLYYLRELTGKAARIKEKIDLTRKKDSAKKSEQVESKSESKVEDKTSEDKVKTEIKEEENK